MAGDWIKMEHATADKPEVFRMALELGITPEHVIGCLFRIWIWADQQTIDGNGVTVTGVTLDRIACNAGISNAMKKVGWLLGDESNYSFPNFDRHNGQTAKNRAVTAKRVAKHRNGGSVTDVTPKVLPEKRREEKKVNIDSRFAEFWSIYPRKTAKANALAAWNKAHINGEFNRVIEAVKAQSRTEQWQKGIVPHAATWINQKRWLDELDSSSNQNSIFAGAI